MNDVEEIDKLLKKYPNRVAVILEPTNNFKKEHSLNKLKYIINGNNSIALFLFHIKQLNNLKTYKSFYLFNHNTLISPSLTFNQLKQQYNNEKVLFLTIDCESAFG